MTVSRYDKARETFDKAGAMVLWHDNLETGRCSMLSIDGSLYFLQEHAGGANECHVFRFDDLGGGMTWDSVLDELKKRHTED